MCSGYVEGMFSRLKSKSEALELENTRLREAICLPDLEVLFDLCVCVFVCLCAHKMAKACIYVRTYTLCMHVPMLVFVHRSLVDVVSRGGGGICISL